MPTQTINLNSTLPANPAHTAMVQWEADTPSLDPTIIRNASANVLAATTSQVGVVKPDGTSIDVASDGGISVPTATTSLKGIVKPDGVAIVVDGTGKINTQITVQFMMAIGTTGTILTPPGRLIAPRAGAVNKCKVIVNTSDPSVPLTFRIKQNGVDVFSADPTIAAGTAVGVLSTFTTLTSTPLAIAADDIFTIDITSGSSLWSFTAQLE